MKAKMEAVEVLVHFDAQGRATPTRFAWRGVDYVVDSTGRRWEDQDGQHMLVMIPGGQTFELLFSPSEMLWYLSSIGPFSAPA